MNKMINIIFSLNKINICKFYSLNKINESIKNSYYELTIN